LYALVTAMQPSSSIHFRVNAPTLARLLTRFLPSLGSHDWGGARLSAMH
jgi:hypothetical protein